MGLFKKSYSASSDEKLMQLVANREAAAFNELYERYSRVMLNYFYRMLWQDREKAEDFMQDLFAKLIHKPELYDASRNFKTWLYSIANNMCKNEYRKQEVRKGVVNGINEEIMAIEKQNQEKQVDDKIFNKRLYEELDKLDVKQKETFVLRYVEDLPIKEIATICECSEGTIKSRLFYTLKKLALRLEDFKLNLSEY